MSTRTNTIVDDYVRTVNEGDAEGYLELFGDDAVVNDAGRQIHSIAEIKKWSESDIFAVQVTFDVLSVSMHDDEAVLTTKVDGNFDRTGLPEPVIIVHQLRVAEGKIVSLNCRLGKME